MVNGKFYIFISTLLVVSAVVRCCSTSQQLVSCFEYVWGVIYSNNVLWLGASLFHVVVETDEISTRIIRYLTSEKGGRVTFMPLNQIRAHNVHYPTGPDVVPLLKKLKYEDQFRPAFAQVKRGLPSQCSIPHSGWELGDLAFSSWSAWS